jgi:hypothetical protein
MRVIARKTADFVFIGLMLFAVWLGLFILAGSLLRGISEWNQTESLLLLNAAILALILRELWLRRRSTDLVFRARDTQFPVFSRAELMEAQEAHSGHDYGRRTPTPRLV